MLVININLFLGILIIHKILQMINLRKMRMKSSPYGPYELGYKRATMTITKGYTKLILSKSIKIVVFGL